MKRLSTPCNQEMNAIAIIFGNDTTATISWAAGSAVVVPEAMSKLAGSLIYFILP